MTLETAREDAGLDPVVRALLESRARQSGVSSTDYLTQLILAPHHGGAALAGTSISPGLDAGPREGVWAVAGSPGQTATNRMIHFHGGGHVLSEPGASPLELSSFSLSPALRLVVVFNERIHGAALLISAAFAEATVSDFRRSQRAPTRRTSASWFEHVVTECVIRSREVCNALVHSWVPTMRAEQIALDAFVLLTDLTPARTELLQLCRYDRPRAFAELAKHLDLITDQFRLSAALLAETEGREQTAALAKADQSDVLRAELLERAGGGLSLTKAAKLLGITRQALHKRVKAGSAIGIMEHGELVLPRAQFVTNAGKTRLIGGLAEVTALFSQTKAGAWSALQFLLDPDPNLGQAPLHSLLEGQTEAVRHAARAYLSVDED